MNLKTILWLSLAVFYSLNINVYSQSIEGGYADNISVAQGETINFFISSSIQTFDINIYKIETSTVRTFMHRIPDIAGTFQPVPDSAYAKGCNWNLTASLNIPENWVPGVYRADFLISGGFTSSIFFVVRENVPGSYSRILYCLNTETWQAYNLFGGRSLYNTDSTVRSNKVSWHRPLVNYGKGNFYQQEALFVSYATDNNISIEIVADYDFDKNPNLASNYDIIIFSGHNEYWSHKKRTQIENYINNGGKLIAMSGNICWWQIRYEDDYRTVVCYKSRVNDPLNGVVDSLVTVNWVSAPVNKPEARFLGASFYAGGFVNNRNTLPASEGYGDYAAFNTQHWVYKGTNLNDGDEFGYDTTIAGNEVDGSEIFWENGLPKPLPINQAPSNLTILGYTPAFRVANDGVDENGIIGFYHRPNGGAVFNAPSIDWGYGLRADTTVQQMMRNVFKNFQANNFPPDIVYWSPFTVISRTINNKENFINDRNITVNGTESVRFSVKGENFNGGVVNYLWSLNDSVVGNDSFYVFQNTNIIDEELQLTAYVYNSYDTVGISWNIHYIVPVELTSFTASLKDNAVYLNWVTKSELNNLGFDIERKNENEGIWSKIGFIEGIGTSTESNQYFYIDKDIFKASALTYRLKQIDSDGTVIYTDEISVKVSPSNYELIQNYPNPFNPSTSIRFSVPRESNIKISIYNLLGQKVTELTNQRYKPGIYNIDYKADDFLSSGTYIYIMNAEDNSGKAFSQSRKMILIK